MQRAHRVMLDLVSAGDLPGDELGVADDLDLARTQRACVLQPQQERPVLGDVVCGLPEQFRCLLQDLTAGAA